MQRVKAVLKNPRFFSINLKHPKYESPSTQVNLTWCSFPPCRFAEAQDNVNPIALLRLNCLTGWADLREENSPSERMGYSPVEITELVYTCYVSDPMEYCIHPKKSPESLKSLNFKIA